MTPVNSSLDKGATRQFTATAMYSDGSTQNVTTSATWTSSTTATATVSDTTGSKGLAIGVAGGTASISAAFGGLSGSTNLTVVALDRLDLSPANPSLARGTTMSLTATAVYSNGATQNVTSSANWSTGAAGTATVGDTAGSKGVLAGVNVGSTTVSASFDGVTGTGSVTVTAATPVSLAITPTNPSLPDGSTQQLTATATFTDGSTQNVTTNASWSSSAPAIAAVDNSASKGLVTAMALGSSVITAQFSTVSATTNVTVTAAVPSSLSVTPSSPSVPKGTTQQFAATLVYTDGSTQDVTSSAAWNSSNTSVAPVSNSEGTKGLAAGSSTGTATISAAAQGVSGSTTMTVTTAAITSIDVTPKNSTVPAGYERQFTATALLSDGTTRDVTQDVAWASNNTDIATVGNAAADKGRATGVATGSTTILAQSEAVQGSTTLTVSGATLTSIGVTPSNPSVPLGNSKSFTATGTFSDSSTEDLTSQVSWSSSATSVATISNADGTRGLASTVATGTTTISAERSGTAVSGSTILTVVEAALTTIEISPDPASVAEGLTLQFTATGVYTDGSTQDITAAVTWSSSNDAVATISNAGGSKGLAMGVEQGTVAIDAALSGVNDSASLTVTAAVLQSIAVTPANPSVPQGLQQQFVATGSYSDGSSLNITNGVTWASSDTSKATISNAPASKGLVSTAAEGLTTISATSGSVAGSTDLTVTAVALTSITVTPDNASVATGLTLQLKATGNYTDASTQDLTSQVTWSSSDPATADVSNAAGSKGRVNAANTGTVTITATDPTTMIADTTSVTVTAAVLTGITVTPANAKLPVGFSRPYTATGNYSDGSSQDLTTTVSWSSLNTEIATVSNAPGTKGAATGVAAGSTTIVATTGGVSGQTSVAVTAETLASIMVTPTSVSFGFGGGSQQYQASGTFSGGTALNITTQVTWASSNTSKATISNTDGSRGLATAPGGATPGSTTISATRDGVTGTATLTRTFP